MEEVLSLSEKIDEQQDSNEIIEFCGLSFSLDTHKNEVKFLKYSEKVTARHKEH